jgi:hypothetical protein
MAKTELASDATDKLAEDLLAGKVDPDKYMEKHRAITKGAPSLNGLAQQINTEHQLVLSSGQSTMAHAVRTGELLIDAKKKCKHGQWLPWVEANCEFTRFTAHRYMKAAEMWRTRNISDADPALLSDLARIIGGRATGDSTRELPPIDRQWDTLGERIRKLADHDLPLAYQMMTLFLKEIRREYRGQRRDASNDGNG